MSSDHAWTHLCSPVVWHTLRASHTKPDFQHHSVTIRKSFVYGAWSPGLSGAEGRPAHGTQRRHATCRCALQRPRHIAAVLRIHTYTARAARIPMKCFGITKRAVNRLLSDLVNKRNAPSPWDSRDNTRCGVSRMVLSRASECSLVLPMSS